MNLCTRNICIHTCLCTFHVWYLGILLYAQIPVHGHSFVICMHMWSMVTFKAFTLLMCVPVYIHCIQELFVNCFTSDVGINSNLDLMMIIIVVVKCGSWYIFTFSIQSDTLAQNAAFNKTNRKKNNTLLTSKLKENTKCMILYSIKAMIAHNRR